MPRIIYSPEHRKLTALLRSLREDAGMTQSELGARLRRSQSFVSKYETGQRRLDPVELRRVARAVGTTLPEVVDRFESVLRTRTRRRGAS